MFKLKINEMSLKIRRTYPDVSTDIRFKLLKHLLILLRQKLWRLLFRLTSALWVHAQGQTIVQLLEKPSTSCIAIAYVRKLAMLFTRGRARLCLQQCLLHTCKHEGLGVRIWNQRRGWAQAICSSIYATLFIVSISLCPIEDLSFQILHFQVHDDLNWGPDVLNDLKAIWLLDQLLLLLL